MAFDPAIGGDDFDRIRRGHQHLRKQCVRIERDRRDHLVELVLRERFVAAGAAVPGAGAGLDGGACAAPASRGQRHSALAIIDLKPKLFMVHFNSIAPRKLYHAGNEGNAPVQARRVASHGCARRRRDFVLPTMRSRAQARSTVRAARDSCRFGRSTGGMFIASRLFVGSRAEAGCEAESAPMNLKSFRLAKRLGFLALSGCMSIRRAPPYAPAPMYPQPTTQQRFDRSWSAAAGALSDQGLTIAVAGSRRRRDPGERAASRLPQQRDAADGRIQVKFTSRAATVCDPALMQRCPDSYDRRMGR